MPFHFLDYQFPIIILIQTQYITNKYALFRLEKNFNKYYKMKPTKYEIAESIDMMRIIENGEKVKMIEIDDDVISVDTPKDLRKSIKLIKKDNFTQKYING